MSEGISMYQRCLLTEGMLGSFPGLNAQSSPTKIKRFIDDVPETLVKRADANSTVCAQGTTPACLQELYNLPANRVKNNVTLGVSVFYGNEPHYAALEVRWIFYPCYVFDLIGCRCSWKPVAPISIQRRTTTRSWVGMAE